MNKELPENKDVAENNYQRYLELGGIINEKDYQSALDRMNSVALDRSNPRTKSSIALVSVITRHSGIELSDSMDSPDPRILLYIILRSDVREKGVRHHHSEMSDQRIFGEVLRMLGDSDSLNKLIKAYPNISFEYEREKKPEE